jgi:hypothetical protein
MFHSWHPLFGGLYSAPLIPAGIRSFQRNPPDSSGMKFGRKACYFFHSGVLLFQWNSWILELRLECTGMECNGIWLFGRCCLFVAHLLPNKHKTNVVTTLITTTTLRRRRLPSLMPPPFVTAATVTNCTQQTAPKRHNADTPQQHHASATTQDDHATRSVMTQMTTTHSNDPLHERQ